MLTKKCEYCGKVIVGSTEDQTAYLLLQHKISKHRDKLKIQEIDDKEVSNIKKVLSNNKERKW